MSPRHNLQQQVAERAANRCEYCRMHQSLQGASFHVEHIIPRSRGGVSELDNLAWACPGCNLRKSDRTEATDPSLGNTVALFHPRSHDWATHFEWDEYSLVGRTPIGRATIVTLDMNHSRRILIRKAEQLFSMFPPTAIKPRFSGGQK